MFAKSIGSVFYEEKISRGIRSVTDDETALKNAIDIFHINLDKGNGYEGSARLAIKTVFGNDLCCAKLAIDSAKLGKPFKTKGYLVLTCLLVPPAAIFFWIVIKRLQVLDPNPPEDY